MDFIHVLLVEDNPSDAFLLQEILFDHSVPRQPGIILKCQETLAQTIEHLTSCPVDVILLDLSLPDSAGLETFYKIHNIFSHIAIIVLTGLGDDQLGTRAVSEGAQDFIVKSELSESLLYRAIHYSFKRKQSENELLRYRNHLEDLVKERTTELIQSQERLRQSERLASIGALAAGIAHEINNPIGVMILAAENAKEQLPLLKTAEPILELTERTLNKVLMHARRCALIVKGVLQFSKRESSVRSFHDVNVIVGNAVQVFCETLDTSRLQLNLELSQEIQAAFVSPMELEQVVVNLLQNAVESQNGSPSVVAVQTLPSTNGLQLIVEDRGKGISDDDLKHIFDPFFTTRERWGGTGLGLSIVHGIVSSHDGTIAVQSEIGRGTRVVVELPYGNLTNERRSDGNSSRT